MVAWFREEAENAGPGNTGLRCEKDTNIDEILVPTQLSQKTMTRPRDRKKGAWCFLRLQSSSGSHNSISNKELDDHLFRLTILVHCARLVASQEAPAMSRLYDAEYT